jgi:hypothetical protein
MMIILLLFLQKQNLANCFALDREIAVHVVLSLCGLCKCSTHDLKNNHSTHTLIVPAQHQLTLNRSFSLHNDLRFTISLLLYIQHQLT